jgi:predicted secreted protein
MLLKKIILILAGFLIPCFSGLWAGDSASFVDLGFSQDGRIYMFGQFGVQSPTLRPWAELFLVDVPTNSFVPNGRISYTQDSAIKAGQDGSGVLYRLITNNSNLAARYGIDYQNQGQPLYISLNDNPPESGETIEFRDFVSNKEYRAQLVSLRQGSGQNVKSSFYINLRCTSLDTSLVKNYSIGNPGLARPLIMSYNIKKVLVNAQGNSLIFVIEMKRVSENGYDIRYMVEALRL